MGTFTTNCTITHIVDRARTIDVADMLVDTGSEHTWIPGKTLDSLGVVREKKDLTFVMANGQQITRSVGYAIVRVGPYVTVDEVVFSEEGDLTILGARSLEGLNLKVDSLRKTLVAAGPLPAAAVSN